MQNRPCCDNVLLVGASVSYHAQHVRQIVPGVEETSATLDEYVGLGIVYRVGSCFDDGAPPKITQIESGFLLGPVTARRVMDKLIDKGIIAVSGEAGDRLVRAQPFDRLEMSRVLAVVREPATSLPDAILSERAVVDVAEKIAASVQQSVEGTVADWIRGTNR